MKAASESLAPPSLAAAPQCQDVASLVQSFPRAPRAHTMLDSHFWIRIGARVPGLVGGRVLHHAALVAADRREPVAARRLFAAAAAAYRRELEIERLARLRVHELMVRMRSAGPEEETALTLEVERRLARLERIERLEPPFAETEARALLAVWLATPETREDAPAALAA